MNRSQAPSEDEPLPTASGLNPVMVDRGLTFILKKVVDEEYGWREYVRDLYKHMTGASRDRVMYLLTDKELEYLMAPREASMAHTTLDVIERARNRAASIPL